MSIRFFSIVFSYWFKSNLFDSAIDGSVFIHPNKNILVKGQRPPRIRFLDDIPSPYLSGMLDNFFDGRLSPLLETNRGCPFKCSFCHTGNDYFQKIHMFSIERIKQELEYIAIRSSKKKNIAVIGIQGIFRYIGELYRKHSKVY